jgi:4-methyl-5(b-hydroxyethyl)-thiazole monophosphate biosynthesis
VGAVVACASLWQRKGKLVRGFGQGGASRGYDHRGSPPPGPTSGLLLSLSKSILSAMLISLLSLMPLHLRHSGVRTRISTPIRALAAASIKPAVLVPIADDSEEIETACITDTLVRAGIDVTIASVMPDRLQCKMSRGLNVVADVSIAQCAGRKYDAIALPGGMPGAEHLRDCETLTTMLKAHAAAGGLTAAVCASPAVVLAAHGLLRETATCYPAPAFKEVVPGWTEAKAVVDGNVLTSQGPGTSLQFALKLVELLVSRDKAEEIAAQMLTETAA